MVWLNLISDKYCCTIIFLIYLGAKIQLFEQKQKSKPIICTFAAQKLSSMQYIVAQWVSFIFHPIFMVSYMAILLLWANPYIIKTYDVALIVFYTAFYPLVSLFLMKRLDFVSSYELPDRRERIVAAIPTLFFYSWCSLVMHKKYHPLLADISYAATASIVLSVVFLALNNKISWHAMGMGAFVAFCVLLPHYATIDVSLPFLLGLVIAGLVGTARLYLQKHQLSEVYQGYLVGFVGQSLFFLW